MATKTHTPDYSRDIRACCLSSRFEDHLANCRRAPGRCRTKAGYPTRKDALGVWGISGSDPTYSAYRCYSCELWHIGRPSEQDLA